MLIGQGKGNQNTSDETEGTDISQDSTLGKVLATHAPGAKRMVEMKVLKQLHEWGNQLNWMSEKEKHDLNLVIECGGNITEAARRSSQTRNAVKKSIMRIRKKAARLGFSPEHGWTNTVPDGYRVKGVSTLYDNEGNQLLQWVKSESEKDDYERLLDALEVLKEDYRGLSVVPKKVPKEAKGDILTVYPLADPHIGLYAWFEETGNDFDVGIARDIITKAIARAVAISPPSEQAIIVNLGDFFHADNILNETLQSHNSLDVDTRWPKVLGIGIEIMRTIVDTTLTKHKNVTLFNEIGNHDPHTSIMLSAVMSAYYENNERVNVVTQPRKMHYYQFGKNLFGFTHGDTIKPEMLGQVMAADVPDLWGLTTHRYWLTGHIHTRRVFELPGCYVESFNTLAAKDSWTYSHGYRSARTLHSIVYHKEYGEIERHVVDVSRVV